MARRRGYVLLETAAATGNRLLGLTSKDGELVYAVLRRELGQPCGQRLWE